HDGPFPFVGTAPVAPFSRVLPLRRERAPPVRCGSFPGVVELVATGRATIAAAAHGARRGDDGDARGEHEHRETVEHEHRGDARAHESTLTMSRVTRIPPRGPTWTTYSAA